jgi:8-amino-7-oxononanoate synthase
VAHATGVLGPQGRGLAAPFEGRDNVITLHTCGKALGTVGGFILAPRVIRDFLVNRARPVCTENLSSGVVVVKSAKDGV